jgi:hypothetical protein
MKLTTMLVPAALAAAVMAPGAQAQTPNFRAQAQGLVAH